MFKLTTLEYFLVPFTNVFEVRSPIKKKKKIDRRKLLFGKMMKNQYQEWFFDNSGNGFDTSDPENPYTIFILDQHSIAFPSKVIGLKST